MRTASEPSERLRARSRIGVSRPISTGPRDSRQPASAAHRAAVATVAASTRSARCHHDRLKIFGYDETHMGIRNNAAVAAHLNAVLETP